MDKMFDGSDDSDANVTLQTNNEYAKNYSTWRQKELFNQLKTKYQGQLDSNDDETSSSEDDDDDDVDFPENVEVDFLKTLSSLKNQDPKIYDDKVKFFGDTPIDPTVKKKKRDQSMFLKDYERKMLLEHGGMVDEEEDNNKANNSRGLTYVQEQENIKKSIKSALDDVDDEENNFGGLFKTRVKTKEEQVKEELNYKQWLKGEELNLENTEDEESLKPLKEYWNDPELDPGEKFLRDYILNNRFKESNDPNYVPTYDEIVHDDEALSDDECNVEKQEEFEHKFNYRFEEPDQEFLKRYPRTIDHSLRKTDDRRKVKRQEIKERKIKEKQEKMEDIQKLKEIKRQEIEEKIKKLKEITGNTDVGFEDQDIDDDFDPDTHDKRMHVLFNDEFYQAEEGDEKPEFPDIDKELEIERWDKFHKEQINAQESVNDYTPHAEDEDFNMDCDYDPSTSTQDELIENTKGRKKRRRKSKFATAVSDPKPLFDPNDKTYEQYLDEYYKLDCEDIVGGIPCRFKYRKVTPNTFGLTVDEILKANDKELNRWCSIKKAIQYRPEHVEKYDQIAYSKKAQNEALKRKILPSLYENDRSADNAENSKGTKRTRSPQSQADETPIAFKKIKLNASTSKIQAENEDCDNNEEIQINERTEDFNESIEKTEQKKGKKKQNKLSKETTGNPQDKLTALEGIKQQTTAGNLEISTNDTKKGKQKKNKQTTNIAANNQPPSKKNYNSGNNNLSNENKLKQKMSQNKGNFTGDNKNKNNKSHKKNNSKSPDCEMSDARLRAFGIKPKKFKNKLKYVHN